MSLPYSDGYPFALPVLEGADNHGEWLLGLKMAAKTQSVSDVLFGSQPVLEAPKLESFTPFDAMPPAPFDKHGFLQAVPGPERLLSYQIALAQYQDNRDLVARANELLFSSTDSIIHPLIVAISNPSDVVKYLGSLFRRSREQVREEAAISLEQLQLHKIARKGHASNFKLLPYISSFLQHIATFPTVDDQEYGDNMSEGFWCSEIISGLPWTWRFVAEGFRDGSRISIDDLIRSLFSWGRIMRETMLANSAETGDGIVVDKRIAHLADQWILSLGQEHIVSESRWIRQQSLPTNGPKGTHRNGDGVGIRLADGAVRVRELHLPQARTNIWTTQDHLSLPALREEMNVRWALAGGDDDEIVIFDADENLLFRAIQEHGYFVVNNIVGPAETD